MMTDRPKATTFDVDLDTLASLWEAFPEREIEAVPALRSSSWCLPMRTTW
jgi:hypothetical protein